jgi:hypothetical protein
VLMSAPTGIGVISAYTGPQRWTLSDYDTLDLASLGLGLSNGLCLTSIGRRMTKLANSAYY